MSDDHDKPTPISLVPSVLGFAATSVVAAAVMLLALIFNYNGTL